VLYVDLVHKITEEENWNDILSAFEDFQQNEKILKGKTLYRMEV
jgi:hypothetical protein